MYYANYADGTKAKKEHLKDEMDFLAAARAGRLPAVSFVKPSGGEDEHPGSSDVLRSESHAVDLINAVLNGPDWKDAVIILTYDENGGFWDHVPPPVIDKWGPGTRIPFLVISPYAKRNFVSHARISQASIVRFIEDNWLGGERIGGGSFDTSAGSIMNMFDFKAPLNIQPMYLDPEQGTQVLLPPGHRHQPKRIRG